MDFRIAVLPGDGIGPEVTAEAVRVLEAVGEAYGHTFDLPHGAIGGNAIDAFGTALPAATLELVESSDAVLFGAAGGPKWDDPKATVRAEQGLLTLRKKYDLFANLRPVTVYPELVAASPVRPELLRDVDMVVVRELAGGLYYGKPKRRWTTRRGRRGVDTLSYTEAEIVRVLRVAFELAQGRRKRLASVDKANALETGRLWRELANEVARDYPDVAVEHLLADAASMLLVRDPRRFDVLVAENTFGDILSDEAAVLSGSLGLLPFSEPARHPPFGGAGLRPLRADPRQRTGHRGGGHRQPHRGGAERRHAPALLPGPGDRGRGGGGRRAQGPGRGVPVRRHRNSWRTGHWHPRDGGGHSGAGLTRSPCRERQEPRTGRCYSARAGLSLSSVLPD